MKRSIALWQLLGFGVTSLLGTLLHFLYDILDKSPLIAPFSGVNESTWEHMKLLFWPMLLFAIAESLLFKDREDLFNVKLRGILLGLILIPILFYTYNGVIGKSPDFVNIAIFFISAAISYIYKTVLFCRHKKYIISQRAAISILLILALLFVIFTFKTPHLGIFRDPVTGAYGIQ
jgi:hypothetical protein